MLQGLFVSGSNSLSHCIYLLQRHFYQSICSVLCQQLRMRRRCNNHKIVTICQIFIFQVPGIRERATERRMKSHISSSHSSRRLRRLAFSMPTSEPAHRLEKYKNLVSNELIKDKKFFFEHFSSVLSMP